MEAGQLSENEGSSQGNLESAPVTLCPAQAFFDLFNGHNTSPLDPHTSSPSLTYGQTPELSLSNSLESFGVCLSCPESL